MLLTPVTRWLFSTKLLEISFTKCFIFEEITDRFCDAIYDWCFDSRDVWYFSFQFLGTISGIFQKYDISDNQIRKDILSNFWFLFAGPESLASPNSSSGQTTSRNYFQSSIIIFCQATSTNNFFLKRASDIIFCQLTSTNNIQKELPILHFAKRHVQIIFKRAFNIIFCLKLRSMRPDADILAWDLGQSANNAPVPN